MMEKIISRRKRQQHPEPAPSYQTEDSYARALRRSKEARDHLQDLLERSDQKAGFVVTGIAFLGFFVQQGNFERWLTIAALNCYGLAFIFVCITAFPRKWGWYRPRSRGTLREQHLQETFQEELQQNCDQEADLRSIYRQKNGSLMIGFVFLILGMIATQIAVLDKYI
jgi:Flp pilus assembly protein TadB